MKYRINWFNSKYDNEVKSSEDLTWDELCGIFSEHRVTKAKNDLGFVMAEFKTEDYLPATYPIYDYIDNEKIEIARDIKLDENGNTFIGRYAENVIAYHCLVFDYDGKGVLLQDKMIEFADFKHIGYTSHNHIISGMHKFRMIFPFSDPCPIEEWKKREDAFRDFGGVDDRSTTAKARIFFAPTCPQEGVPHKFAWNMDGEILDWRVFPVKQQKQTQIKPQQINSNNPQLSITGTGKVHYETFDMVAFMQSKGMYVSGNSQGKHDVRCFREHEHNTNRPGGTVVWQKRGEWPSFYCGHSHSLTSADFWKHYKKSDIEQFCLKEVIAPRRRRTSEEIMKEIIEKYGVKTK